MSSPLGLCTDRAPTDPRPRLVTDESGRIGVAGHRCVACHLARADPAPWCAACRSPLTPAIFGPRGTVWSSTVLHIEVGDLPAPVGLAYVDIDDGPRILAHVAGTTPIGVGTRVRVHGCTPTGDVAVVPEPGPADEPRGGPV